MSQYKLAVFDLDGVLTETSEQHFLAWKALADELNIPFDRELNEQLKGVSRMESLEIILNNDNKSDAFIEEEKVALATKKNEIYKTLIDEFTPNHLFEGVKELFGYLKDNDIKIALASASKNGPTLLNKMGVADEFDVVVNPAELKKGKPDPEIFLTAAEKLGIDPKDAIGFEDAVAGVKAIKSAGMFAVGIGKASILTQADVVYHEIKDLELEQLFS